MKIIAGQAVRGDDFWDRPHLMEDILETIENDGHILLVAPRRVGKTSLMYRVLDTIGDKHIVIYVNTEAEHTFNAFWEKLFYTLKDPKFLGTLEQRAHTLFQKISSIRLSEIGLKGIKFGESEPIDYAKAFEQLLKSYDGEQKLIIMLDEFSQTIENIIQHESKEKAEELLQIHRALRQNHTIAQKSVFIYAGSIGLEGVVSSIQASKHINDLDSISVPPLDLKDAKKFTACLASTNNMELDTKDIDYLLEKIQWHIPFYIQLIVKELKRLYRREAVLDSTVIDHAIEKVLQQRKDFIHWEERLSIFSSEEKNFAKEILNTISEQNTIESKEIINIATKYHIETDKANKILHTLKYDGYINNQENPKLYCFNSPLLQTWWYKNVAN